MKTDALLQNIRIATRQAIALAQLLDTVNFAEVMAEEQDTDEFRGAWADLELALIELTESDLMPEKHDDVVRFTNERSAGK